MPEPNPTPVPTPEPGMPPIREPAQPRPGPVPPKPEPSSPPGEPLPRPGEPIPAAGGLFDPRFLEPGPGKQDMPLPITQPPHTPTDPAQ